ncbi:MAG: exo-alpha-sialidase [Deltaproteobacteria bacterium]|nr:exo-alpha-sialidase [Deltaproteobacteria bacterium]
MRGGRWWVVVGAAVLVGTPTFATPAGATAPVFGPAAPVVADAAGDAGNDGAPRIVTDGQGAWITVWTATRGGGGILGPDADVLAARSSDLGISWSLPVAVNAGAATDAEFDFAPALATDGRGLWIAVWVASHGPDTDLFSARSTDAGQSWSAAQPLHADAAGDAANDDHPQIATDGLGTWIVVWDANARAGGDRDVFAARSVDGGLTWSPPAPIAAGATTDRGSDQRPQLATDGDGRWVVVWASSDTLGGVKGNDFDILTARSTDGGATWSPPAALNGNAASDTGLDDRPQIVTDGAGTWVVAWVSDENLGGALGTDLDVLTARSTDGGATWSAPAALNTNAAADAGEDGAPALATDGAGTWVAAWESTDTLGGALGDDYDVIMAHSIDGGAHWSAPRALDPDAARDARRDVAVQLAIADGVWNAVWAVSAGVFGTDTDVVRAGGRERCGDGVVDPGEQCDDGNVRGGDVCPASCEFPPSVTTPTPTPGAGVTSAPAGNATPTAEPSGTPGAPTGHPADTPTPGASDAPTPTPTASAGEEPTATPDEEASATPTTTPTLAPIPPATATPTAAPGGSGGPTASATPRPAPTFAGSLAGAARAKAAVACQRALFKAGAQVVGARLGKLGGCARAVHRCVQTRPGDGACLAKAGTRCRNALAALATTDEKQSVGVRRRCGGNVPLADLLAPAGLGYAGTACGAEAESLDDLLVCVIGAHACASSGILAILQPRVKELLRLPGMNASTLDSVACLPDHGGDGESVGDPGGAGKTLDACTAAIVKAGTGFARKRLARLAKCVDGLFACVQTASDDGACLTKARAKCEQGGVASVAEEGSLARTVAARCGEALIPYATLRAAPAANLAALDAACAAVGVPELTSLADYQRCVVRSDACRVEALVAAQAPRAEELLAVVGRSLASPACSAR